MIRRVKRFNAPALGSPRSPPQIDQQKSWGSFGASWAPKLGQVGSQRRLGRGLGSKKRFFKSTTFSLVKPHILASRSRPRQAKIGPRPAEDRPERPGVSFGCLWGLFWRPLALKIGAKFDQKIVDNKNRPKMTPRESKSPPGTPLRPPQDPPRAPQDPPRSTPGASKLVPRGLLQSLPVRQRRVVRKSPSQVVRSNFAAMPHALLRTSCQTLAAVLARGAF